MTVTLYSRPNCNPCRATKRKLKALGVDFEELDTSIDPEARAFAMSLGHLESPVVYVNAGHHWSGYRPDRLDALVA